MSELPQDVRREVEEQLRGKRLIGAIKAYRNATGSSLAEARDAVLEIQREMRSEQASSDGSSADRAPTADLPAERDPVVRTRSGCFSVLLVATAGLWWFWP